MQSSPIAVYVGKPGIATTDPTARKTTVRTTEQRGRHMNQTPMYRSQSASVYKSLGGTQPVSGRTSVPLYGTWQGSHTKESYGQVLTDSASTGRFHITASPSKPSPPITQPRFSKPTEVLQNNRSILAGITHSGGQRVTKRVNSIRRSATGHPSKPVDSLCSPLQPVTPIHQQGYQQPPQPPRQPPSSDAAYRRPHDIKYTRNTGNPNPMKPPERPPEFRKVVASNHISSVSRSSPQRTHVSRSTNDHVSWNTTKLDRQSSARAVRQENWMAQQVHEPAWKGNANALIGKHTTYEGFSADELRCDKLVDDNPENKPVDMNKASNGFQQCLDSIRKAYESTPKESYHFRRDYPSGLRPPNVDKIVHIEYKSNDAKGEVLMRPLGKAYLSETKREPETRSWSVPLVSQCEALGGRSVKKLDYSKMRVLGTRVISGLPSSNNAGRGPIRTVHARPHL